MRALGVVALPNDPEDARLLRFDDGERDLGYDVIGICGKPGERAVRIRTGAVDLALEHLFGGEEPRIYQRLMVGWRRVTIEPDVRAFVRAQCEMRDDVRNGRIPATVASFSELHDYVDANAYGGTCDEGPDAWEWDDIAEVNAMQDALDAWIRRGNLARVALQAACRLCTESGLSTPAATIGRLDPMGFGGGWHPLCDLCKSLEE